jgi:hypothetical protein
MTRYEIVLEGDSAAHDYVPEAGETLQVGGALWKVESVEATADECPRVHLVPCASDGPDVEAHRRAPVKALAPPTSFESELVYTLTDLSTRLSALAQVLTSYWGKGAA